MDPFETSLYTAVLITGVVLGTVILFFAISVFRYQRRHFKLQRLSFLAEVALLEKERTRIASDLHDELGPLLTVAKYQIDVVSLSAPELAQLQKAKLQIENVIERLGGIAVNLTPRALVKKGLRVALEDFFEHYKGVSSLRFRFVYDVPQDIAQEIGIHIYRIVQEVVHNAFKHSDAQFIYIHLKQKKNTLYLLCKDNGKGFVTDDPFKTTQGIGLRSLKNRAEMLGGKMQHQSKPGSGVEYFFEIPLNTIHGKEDKGVDS